MKKQVISKIAFAILATLALCMAASMTIFASDHASAYVYSKSNAQVGEEVTFTVDVNNGDNIKAMMITPDYNKNAFELVDGEWLVKNSLLSDFSLDTGDGVIAFDGGVSVNQSVFSFTLRVKKLAQPGIESVSAQVIITDSNGQYTINAGDSRIQIGCNHEYSKKDLTYPASPATCNAAAKYYYSCIYCSEKGSKTFESGEKLDHNYQTNWSFDDTSHWNQCSACDDKKNMQPHTPGAPATEGMDQVCTVCNYVITPAESHTHEYSLEWISDSYGHWHECACGERFDEEVHHEGAEATEETDQVCTVCNYVIKTALGHTHKYDKEWKNDSDWHWNECSCGKRNNLAKHGWNDGVITKEATESEQGIMTYTCIECSASRTEAIAKLPTTPDNPTVDDPTVDDPTVDDPTFDDPTVDDPTVDEPIVDDLTTDKPVEETPDSDDPDIVLIVTGIVFAVGCIAAGGVIFVIRTNKLSTYTRRARIEPEYPEEKAAKPKQPEVVTKEAAKSEVIVNDSFELIIEDPNQHTKVTETAENESNDEISGNMDLSKKRGDNDEN